MLNHDSLESWFEFAKANTAGVTYLIMQHEAGTKQEGHHIQGFITMATKKRPGPLGALFQLNPNSFQVMKKNSTPQKNRAYCTDDTKRIKDTVFFEYGTVPGAEAPKLDTFIDLVKSQGLKRAIDSDPATYVRHCNGLQQLDYFYKKQKTEGRIERPVTVYTVWGDPGSGKSWFARNFDTESTYPLPDIEKGSRLNIDGYNMQRTLIIEDYQGEIPYRSLLKMLDVYEADFNTKGAYCPANWNYVIITANMHPCRWYDDRKDPWGTDMEGPLSRRVHYIIQAAGVYPNSTFTWTHEGKDVVMGPEEMPNREQVEANHSEQESDASPTIVDEVPVVEATSNAVPPAPVSDFLQMLEQDWEIQDEATGNDFLAGIHLAGHVDPFDPDGLTFGLDGDAEPGRSVDLFTVT